MALVLAGVPEQVFEYFIFDSFIFLSKWLIGEHTYFDLSRKKFISKVWG